MTVLILAPPSNTQAIAVSKCLTQLGARHLIWGDEQLNSSTNIDFSLDNDRRHLLLRTATGQSLDLNEIRAIWYLRPPRITHTDLPEPWMNRMVESELNATFHGMFRSLDCLFVNHPGRDYDCLFKCNQLDLATRVGFVVPPTIITNQPQVVRAFYDECNGDLIYKLVSEATNFNLPKFAPSAGIPTLPFREEDLEHLEQITLSPHFFQKRIPKQYDIRITAIGRKLFPVKIDSQSGNGTLDWRKDYSVAMNSIELPESVQRSCLRLMEELHLNYGSIDLCVDEKGRYIFFEINCAGVYEWMEERIEGLDLSMELAKLFLGESEPVIAPRHRHSSPTTPSS